MSRKERPVFLIVTMNFLDKLRDALVNLGESPLRRASLYVDCRDRELSMEVRELPEGLLRW
jgi:hypothetical protein